jgi:hypothetical protein
VSGISEFQTTAEFDSSHDFTGQERARSALELGLGISSSGFNIFVSGLAGTEKLERSVRRRNYARNEEWQMATDKRRNRAGDAKKTTRRKKNPEPTPSPPLTLNSEELYGQVATKAYELYQKRGEEHGHDLDDWFTAERLVKDELLHGPVSEEPPFEEP